MVLFDGKFQNQYTFLYFLIHQDMINVSKKNKHRDLPKVRPSCAVNFDGFCPNTDGSIPRLATYPPLQELLRWRGQGQDDRLRQSKVC